MEMRQGQFNFLGRTLESPSKEINGKVEQIREIDPTFPDMEPQIIIKRGRLYISPQLK
jgi:hypothetical protein